MLGEGESPQGSVKRAAGSRDLALVHQKLTVVQPDPRHLGEKKINYYHVYANKKLVQENSCSRTFHNTS